MSKEERLYKKGIERGLSNRTETIGAKDERDRREDSEKF